MRTYQPINESSGYFAVPDIQSGLTADAPPLRGPGCTRKRPRGMHCTGPLACLWAYDLGKQ